MCRDTETGTEGLFHTDHHMRTQLAPGFSTQASTGVRHLAGSLWIGSPDTTQNCGFGVRVTELLEGHK